MERLNVLAFVSDLMFSSRIEATLGAEGMGVRVVDDLAALDAALQEGPALLLLDLHATRAPSEVVERSRAAGVPALAFGRHTEPALLREARRAGCVDAVARSTFVEEMADLVRKHARPDSAGMEP